MLKNSFFKTIPFLLFIVLLNSCDKELNVVGEDLIGDNSFDIEKSEFNVVAYNQKLGPIQSNNLETNPLGVYNNPSFGTTNANFVTQLTLAATGTTFDASATIKSVVLTIPYFVDKTKTVTDASTGASTYVLDSIYGPDKAKMKLSVYESGYYMRDLDPESQFSQPQKFYTNQYSDFEDKKIGSPLNNSKTNPAENSAFFFDPAEYVDKPIVDGKETIVRSAPAMRLNLDANFFATKILKAPVAALADNNAFKEYFRGLFFNIEENGSGPGNMAMINFKAGKITITYTETINNVAADKTFVLNLTGNTVSLLNQSNTNTKYADATKPASDIDKAEGVANLYLKGGEGSMSILKLFSKTDNHGLELNQGPNGVPDELDDMRRNKYLINQADLTFHLNSGAMGESYVPQRIYLYDFTNNQVLVDYRETSTVSSNTKKNKYVFGGILLKRTDGSYDYKFRITNHIRNLVKYKDSTNVDLGLVVTEDINKSSFYTLRDKAGFPLKAPMASVMNPLGVIVFGNNLPNATEEDKKNYDKRLKFEIYYTKPN